MRAAGVGRGRESRLREQAANRARSVLVLLSLLVTLGSLGCGDNGRTLREEAEHRQEAVENWAESANRLIAVLGVVAVLVGLFGFIAGIALRTKFRRQIQEQAQ